MEFLQLNDYCIFDIFKWLTIDDFCALSRTSKRINSLAEDYFARKYYTKHLSLDWNAEQRQVRLSPRKSYVAQFGCFVKRVCIDGTNVTEQSDYESLLNYLISNCNPNMSELYFRYMVLRETDIKWMCENLRKLEILEFNFCNVDCNILNNLLKNCYQLKHLCVNNDNDWPYWLTDKRDHHIRKFYLKTDNDLTVLQSEKIPQLIRCFLGGPHLELRKNFNYIASRAINLEQFCLVDSGKALAFNPHNIDDYLYVNEVFVNDLLTMMNENQVKYFGIKATSQTSFQLNLCNEAIEILKKIQFIIYNDNFITGCIFTYIDDLCNRFGNRHLKRFHIHFQDRPTETYIDFSFYRPLPSFNLEEVYFGFPNDYRTDIEITELVRGFLKCGHKLKKIILHGMFNNSVPTKYVKTILENLTDFNKMELKIVILIENSTVTSKQTSFIEIKSFTEMDKYRLVRNQYLFY